jgi:hypothetical protein
MALVVAHSVADGQVLLVAAAAFAQRLDVLQRGSGGQYVFPADPARHHAMQLAGHGFVDFVAGVAESAHGKYILFVCYLLYSWLRRFHMRKRPKKLVDVWGGFWSFLPRCFCHPFTSDISH